jgi:hypothetical protein
MQNLLTILKTRESHVNITNKKIRKETVQLLYMKRLIYLKNGQSLDLLVSPPKERSALKKKRILRCSLLFYSYSGLFI